MTDLVAVVRMVMVCKVPDVPGSLPGPVVLPAVAVSEWCKPIEVTKYVKVKIYKIIQSPVL